MRSLKKKLKKRLFTNSAATFVGKEICSLKTAVISIRMGYFYIAKDTFALLKQNFVTSNFI